MAREMLAYFRWMSAQFGSALIYGPYLIPGKNAKSAQVRGRLFMQKIRGWGW
jgi:hypothetical protein